MRLIWKLLRKYISLFELGVFFITSLIGMVVILSGVQIYTDIKPLLTGEKSFIGNQYMILSKPVERVGVNSTSIPQQEIDDLREQPFVLDLGEFRSSQYEVYGSLMFQGRRLSTMMFFESVPDKFVDADSEAWHFDEGDNIIPIIIPRNYLSLYNFGFSQTQDLPQITENLIKGVELSIELSGDGRYRNLSGYIVGFSDRLNTILVPENFMSWANDYFAPNASTETTRLIVEVENPTAPEITEYMKAHNLVSEDKPAESDKALFLLKVCVAIIIGIGILFSTLSLIILTLSIYLLLQKNFDKLENLILAGYTPAQVASPYNMIAIGLNISIYIVGVVAVSFIQRAYATALTQSVGFTMHTSLTATIVAGIVLSTAITIFNICIIKRKIAQISHRR